MSGDDLEDEPPYCSTLGYALLRDERSSQMHDGTHLTSVFCNPELGPFPLIPHSSSAFELAHTNRV
jgi:hypothetical protein